jgi:hypothetical protein
MIGPAVPAATAASGAATAQVGTFNMAGNTDTNNGTTGVADAVVKSIGDRDGEHTHADGKLDHIFFTPNLRWGGGDATSSDLSDHDPLWGTLTVR